MQNNIGNLKVSVICPFFNEEILIEESITKLLSLLEKQFDNEFELILVDDGSTDDSLKIALNKFEKLSSQHNVKVLSCPVNQGRGRALKNGIEAATCDIIVTTEVDCSWGDDIVLKMYNELSSKPEIDFVIASPHLLGGGFQNVPLHRVLLSRWGNAAIRTFFDSDITMNTGMTRCYRSTVIQPLVTERNGKEFHLEVLLKLRSIGFRCSEIPATLRWKNKFENQNKPVRKSSTKLLSTIWSHLSFIVIARPIKQFGFLAGFSFLIANAMLLSSMIQIIFYTKQASGLLWVTLASYLLAIIFSAFAVQFFQVRELLRYEWMKPYGDKKPPSKRPSSRAFESKVE